MSQIPQHLGRLEQVDVRVHWPGEATDFTPWLAQSDNMKLLADAIGMELEVESVEQFVGAYRADIVCIETTTERKILIENQLERSDHTHLGQLMTYAAGLTAVTIVWIAKRFTEEHRAALDWLNLVTNDSVEFFGIEIELWRIGESPLAPRFNLVAKPNDWTKPSAIGQRQGSADTSSTTALYQEYWTALREVIIARRGVLRPQKALPQNWTLFAIGRTHFSLYASISQQAEHLRVGLVIKGPWRDKHFAHLQTERQQIESEFGEPLEWHVAGKEMQVRLIRTGEDPTDRTRWNVQHAEIAGLLERFHTVFAKRVRELPEEWAEPDEG